MIGYYSCYGLSPLIRMGEEVPLQLAGYFMDVSYKSGVCWRKTAGIRILQCS